MREDLFLKFLEQDTNITSKTKAVNSRMSKARKVEDAFGIDLDNIVVDDERMYLLLIKIQKELNETNGTIQNAVRKYYLFVNGRVFPNLASYEKRMRIS